MELNALVDRSSIRAKGRISELLQCSGVFTIALACGLHDQRAEQMKVHTMLVIGNRDLEANAVSVLVHGQGNLGARAKSDVIAEILDSIAQRKP